MKPRTKIWFWGSRKLKSAKDAVLEGLGQMLKKIQPQMTLVTQCPWTLPISSEPPIYSNLGGVG